tara:strand:+ start:952 stop:1833 length:882 start_codon:yes stop_codon:yes gene_type:complete
MAETLTYDPTPADQTEFTEEEQKSIKVGEELSEQQDQLLAGKFKDAQELESAYIELQKKLGSNKDSEESVDKPESKEEATEEKTEEDPFANQYLEDGKVNYEEVNKTYGDKLGKVFEEGNVDPWAISKHFHENNGTVTDEMKQSLIDSGLSESSVNAYFAGRAAEMGYNNVSDLSEQEVNSIKNVAGGDKEYNALVEWSNTNVSDEYAAAFDSIVGSGNVEAIKIAVEGLKAKYDEANGYEGRMLTGKSANTNTDVYRSQAEIVRAMSDPRYDSDPAYRQDVYDKLERSDVNF